ncbi:ubiquitin conjugating enzyme E2 E3 [Homo sapiens]|uniref:Ubiquitin conjugating enzyme E2 E3 n=1 Tax=Homo sapiens TaxID=9606 RepID=R4GNG6_HUMAN|nr:ubiquitin conjugating enzyme E2 E3 [Homo sapiens]KAI4037169.1 ubiquitin conjugating enzyme E2 E3 [Homo sapiens]|eukprot:XP_011508794.1 ubiquitin-conjugating enzyme E2 E3 isoform X3 [Homo sapiens]
MSSDRQRSDDESPSTSSGSSDADQRDPAAPEPEEQEERKPSATQQKKNTKLSSKTTAKLSTSAKRIQKELAEITLDPPPNCRGCPCPLLVTTCANSESLERKISKSCIECKDIQIENEELVLSVSSSLSI